MNKALLNRDTSLDKIKHQESWDFVIIGGGATGLGVAVDAASRGFSVLLIEQYDFAKGTSSRSTKLVHGGVRYLAQGNIGLVFSALRERGYLIKNAPHLVHKQPFIVPCYSWWEKIKYVTGLKLYDWLSLGLSFGKSEMISRDRIKELLPLLNSKKINGGVQYFDGQFDDARLAINLAQTCTEYGGTVINYFKAIKLVKTAGKITGVIAQDMESGTTYTLRSKVVVNATGVFVDDILKMDEPESRPLVRSSQGIHLVFDYSFWNSDTAVMIPKTSDGRVLFAVPWHHHILVGTTDTPLEKHSLEPQPLHEEVKFILTTISKYFSKSVGADDVLSVFAGLRPLAAPKHETGNTKEIPRDYKLVTSSSGLVTITGGKWTTYRKMAEATVNKAIQIASLNDSPCITKNLFIHGAGILDENHLSIYGSDAEGIERLVTENKEWAGRLVDNFKDTKAEVIWAVRYEMARSVEDVLARRLRLLFLDAEASMQAAPVVAVLMSEELGRDEKWEKEQVEKFSTLAKNYLLSATKKKLSSN